MTAKAGMSRKAGERRGRSGRVRRWFLLATVAVLVSVVIATLHGCAGWIAHSIVDAPNAGHVMYASGDAPPSQLDRLGVSKQLRVNVGPPDASLSVWIVDPERNSGSPRATVLVLHGIRDDKRSQVSLGHSLAELGYRAVLIDLRGHGRSSGDWLTYGVVESRDISQLLDFLSNRQLLAGPVGAIGSSYGGAVAIQTAAIDIRIKAVVAIAAFTSMPDVIPEYARQYTGSWLVSQRQLDNGIEEAGRIAGFDPSDASPLRAIQRTNAHVLLIHGTRDQYIPYQQSEQLYEAAPDHSELMLLEDEDHISIMSDREGKIAKAWAAWFERYLIPAD